MQTPVILSEAVAEPEDPLPAGAITSSTRSFNYRLAVRTGNWQLGTEN